MIMLDKQRIYDRSRVSLSCYNFQILVSIVFVSQTHDIPIFHLNCPLASASEQRRVLWIAKHPEDHCVSTSRFSSRAHGCLHLGRRSSSLWAPIPWHSISAFCHFTWAPAGNLPTLETSLLHLPCLQVFPHGEPESGRTQTPSSRILSCALLTV